MSDFEDFEDENAEAKIKADIESPDKMVRADAIFRLSYKTYESGNHAKAIVYMESCADLRAEIEDYTGLTFANMQLGWWRTYEKRFKLAFKHFNNAVESARACLNSEAEIDSLHMCGQTQRNLKNHSIAAEYYEQSLNLAVETEYRFVGQIKTDYARMLRKIGRAAEAEAILAGATRDLENNDFDGMVARTDNELASTLINEGNFEAAFEKAKEAFHLADYGENSREMDKAQFLMARAKNKLNKFGEALEIIEQMKSRPNFGKRIKHKVRTDLECITANAGLGRNDEAMKLLVKVVPVLKQKHLMVELAEATSIQARLYFYVPSMLDCEQSAVEARNMAEELGDKDLAIEMTYLLAACYELMERLSDREALLQKITNDPFNEKYQAYWYSASELALHFAFAGNTEAAKSYIDLIKASKSPMVNDAVQAQSLEAQAILFDAAGEKVKAKNARAKAMQTYLIAGNSERATILANLLK